jgi:hypothetical protein
MPNLLTRVPTTEVPPLPAPLSDVIAVADLFMVLMLSRPTSGSLRTTWVTPATLVLTVGTALVSAVCLVVAVSGLSWVGRLAAGVGLGMIAAGSASIAVVGLAQRVGRRER